MVFVERGQRRAVSRQQLGKGDGTDAVGNRTRVKVVKNKVSPPFKIAEFDIMYGEGISRESSIIDLGVENGFIKKSGSWFSYDSVRIGPCSTTRPSDMTCTYSSGATSDRSCVMMIVVWS